MNGFYQALFQHAAVFIVEHIADDFRVKRDALQFQIKGDVRNPRSLLGRLASALAEGSHIRGGARSTVGRDVRISCGNFMRLSENVTGVPQRIGRS